jgi:CheY-like chemotaxis protein
MSDLPAVLVVDDDAATMGLLVAVLKHLGLKPRTAGDGREALAIIAADEPGAIILDLLMPEPDGFDVLRHLRVHAPHMLRRVIVVTAAMGPKVDNCGELGNVWKLFRKPMEIDQFAASLLTCLAEAEQRTGRGSTHGALTRP